MLLLACGKGKLVVVLLKSTPENGGCLCSLFVAAFASLLFSVWDPQSCCWWFRKGLPFPDYHTLRFQDLLHSCPDLLAFSYNVFHFSVGGKIQKKKSEQDFRGCLTVQWLPPF